MSKSAELREKANAMLAEAFQLEQDGRRLLHEADELEEQENIAACSFKVGDIATGIGENGPCRMRVTKIFVKHDGEQRFIKGINLDDGYTCYLTSED